jgi:hypothetical protein
MQSINAKEFFKCFHFESPDMIDKSEFKSSDILNSALIGEKALAIGMDQNPAVNDVLKSVTFTPSRKILFEPDIETRQVTSLQWFNLARQKAGI